MPMRRRVSRLSATSVPSPRATRCQILDALSALAALGQPTRLEVFRLLMRRHPNGVPAGAIAETLGCPQNTLSTHISISRAPDWCEARATAGLLSIVRMWMECARSSDFSSTIAVTATLSSVLWLTPIPSRSVAAVSPLGRAASTVNDISVIIEIMLGECAAKLLRAYSEVERPIKFRARQARQRSEATHRRRTAETHSRFPRGTHRGAK